MKDAQVILSTSQTAFQGLGEPIPTLLPWHIRLSKAFSGRGDGTSGALMSTFEMENRRNGPINVTSKPIEPRNMLFGLSGMSLAPQQAAFRGHQQATQNLHIQDQIQKQYAQRQQIQQPHASAAFGQAAQQHSAPGGLFGSSNVVSSNSAAFGQGAQQHSAPGGLFGSSNVASSNSAPFGSSRAGNPSSEGNHALQDYQMQMMLLEQQNKKRMMTAEQEKDTISGAGGYGSDGEAETIVPELPTLGTQESEWTESVSSP